MLYQGCFSIFPTRSCSAMSTAALAAGLPGAIASTAVRIVSSSKGFVKPLEIHLRQERRGRVVRLAEIRRHRRFAVAHHAVVFDLGQHDRRRGARVRRDGEDMLQLERVRAEPQRAASAGRPSRPGRLPGTTGRPGRAGKTRPATIVRETSRRVWDMVCRLYAPGRMGHGHGVRGGHEYVGAGFSRPNTGPPEGGPLGSNA